MIRLLRNGVFALILVLFLFSMVRRPVSHNSIEVLPTVAADRVTDDPGDPAIWVNRSDPAQSLIIGTNKVKRPTGALVVYGVDGKIRQTIAGLDRPNNVDVEYGLMLGGRLVDIAVATERLQHRLAIYRIDGDHRD